MAATDRVLANPLAAPDDWDADARRSDRAKLTEAIGGIELLLLYVASNMLLQRRAFSACTVLCKVDVQGWLTVLTRE